MSTTAGPGASVDITAAAALRDATPADHLALLALEGTAPQAGAAFIQARRNFFARTDAYSVSRIVVAEHAGRVVGVLCASLTTVCVAGEPCAAGYICNVRVEPTLQARGLGPRMMHEAMGWLRGLGARYVQGLVRTTNTPSMKMVLALGAEVIGRFDYLVLDLARFKPDPEVDVERRSIAGDPTLAAWRLESVALHHFVPLFIHSELFLPPPAGCYAGSRLAYAPGGSAWLSIWDDRQKRGLDPREVRAVKGYDVTVEGPGGFRAFSAIMASLAREGLSHLLLPLPHDAEVRALLDPFVEDLVEFNFVVIRFPEAPPVPPGPIYLDIRH